MNKDFPCKTCTHRADRHYTNVATGGGVCTGCGSDRLVDREIPIFSQDRDYINKFVYIGG
jgi:hypothetical protein